MIRIILCVIISGIVPMAYASDTPVIDVTLNQDALKKGELQTFVETLETTTGGGKKRVIGVIMIEATCAEVWEIIRNWDSYGEFVPGLKYYKTIKKQTFADKPNVFQSYIEGYIKIPVPFIRKTYTLDVFFDQNRYIINWQLVKYDRIQELEKQGVSLTGSSSVVQNIEGFSYLKPFDNGTKTIIYYAPVVEINIPVPQSVERFLSGTIMRGFMEAIKNRVETRKHKLPVNDESSEMK